MTQERILLCRILRLRRVAQATSSIPPQCDPRGAFLCHRKAISYDMKNVCFRGKQTLLGIMQGCKTLHGSFHLFIMSRFPGSQIIVRLLLLIPYGTMETFEALLPAYSDRIAQDLHLIPSLTGRFPLTVHSSCFYGILYNSLIPHCYQIVKNEADILYGNGQPETALQICLQQ